MTNQNSNLAITSSAPLTDQTPAMKEQVRQKLEALWNKAQDMPDEANVITTQAIAIAWEQVQAMQKVAAQQSKDASDIAAVMGSIIDELRYQRNTALNSLENTIRTTDHRAREHVAKPLADELGMEPQLTLALLDALCGDGEVWIGEEIVNVYDGIEAMDARDALRRMAESLMPEPQYVGDEESL